MALDTHKGEELLKQSLYGECTLSAVMFLSKSGEANEDETLHIYVQYSTFPLSYLLPCHLKLLARKFPFL